MDRLQRKVAIVTGAAAGIGSATAEHFAAHGAVVMLADVDADRGEVMAGEIARRYPGRATFVRHDVGEEGSWVNLVKVTLDRFERIDILVNNAGIQISRPLEDITLEEWRSVFRVNAEGTFLGTRYAIGTMKRTGGGSIVNVSSTYAMIADGLNAHYCASKAAVRNFTKAAALYCADRDYNIRVNSVHPGVIATPMLEREIHDVTLARGLTSTDVIEAEWRRICPLGIGTPADVAEGIAYLASDASRYVTGAELVIHGGHIIR
jgi:3(or 17)beta-hydroxysteroid dehydrogenase